MTQLIDPCPRCGQTHRIKPDTKTKNRTPKKYASMEVVEIKNFSKGPAYVGKQYYPFFAMCPVLNEPLLIRYDIIIDR